ncbi:PadR family transcriptional regulator [Sporichthya polymorpha]|uniref:PadR family transcriptional regulator n=1 Tax=Sporichthya polymorpha TaxID=35751 RepID=UPI0012EC496B|nr:PadR family transcriptional regulator [Sporichthya polymorpha]
MTVQNERSTSDKGAGAEKARLGPSAYLVLGFIAELGPSTPYDLKRAVARSIAYFWSFPHSQLYVEPERLAKLGLLSEEQEEHGRRRRLFSITDAGREALREWLESPSATQTETRDLGLLKLYFADLTSPERVKEMAEEQIALHQERLREYDAIAADMARFETLYLHQIPIRMGYLFEEAFITFWTSILENPPSLDPRIPPLFEEKPGRRSASKGERRKR